MTGETHWLIWLRAQLRDVRTEGACSGLELREIRAGIPNRPIHRVRIENAGELDELEATFRDLARADAAGQGRATSYTIVGYFGGSPDWVTSAPVWTCRPPRDSEVAMGPEPVTNGSVVRAAISFAEAATRTSFHAMGQTHEMLVRELERKDAYIRAMEQSRIEWEAKRAEAFELQESAASRAHERAIEAGREKLRLEQEATLAGEVKALLPLLVSRLLGGGLGNPAQLRALQNVLGGINGDEWTKIADLLGPERTVPMLELYRQLLDAAPDETKKLPEAKH